MEKNFYQAGQRQRRIKWLIIFSGGLRTWNSCLAAATGDNYLFLPGSWQRACLEAGLHGSYFFLAAGRHLAPRLELHLHPPIHPAREHEETPQPFGQGVHRLGLRRR